MCEKRCLKSAERGKLLTTRVKSVISVSYTHLDVYKRQVSYAVKDVIIDDWIATQKAYDEADAKTVYYMSMEFLMGRALGNNLINLTAYKEVKEALEEDVYKRQRKSCI